MGDVTSLAQDLVDQRQIRGGLVSWMKINGFLPSLTDPHAPGLRINFLAIVCAFVTHSVLGIDLDWLLGHASIYHSRHAH